MKIPFRQGIIRYQSDITNQPHFLVKSSLAGNYIDLKVSPDPCVITFAHGSTNYSIEEINTVLNAWGPFKPTGETQYLYWDIDLLSGQLSRGFTLVEPATNNVAPTNPVVNTHWFDLSSTTMKVWNGKKWSVKIRLFAGTYLNDASIISEGLGSQVGLVDDGVSGKILFDDQLKPLRASDQTFLTSETNFQINSAANNPNSAIRFESLLCYVTAGEYIPKFSAVTIVSPDTVMLGRYTERKLVHGIVTEDMHIGDLSRLITSGIVYNEQWNFTLANIGQALFCGPTGQLTFTPPPAGIIQMIGTVASNKTVNINVQAPVYYVMQP